MNASWQRPAGAAVLMILASVAQAGTISNIQKVDVQAATAISYGYTQIGTIRSTYQAPDKSIFVILTCVLEARWEAGDTKGVEIGKMTGQMKGELSDGSESYEAFSNVYRGAGLDAWQKPWLNGPRGKEGPTKIIFTYQPVFIVPVGKTDFTLKVGQAEAKLKVQKVEKVIDLTVPAKFDIKACRLEDSATRPVIRRPNDVPFLLTNPGGKFLIVSAEVTPTGSNTWFTDSFCWEDQSFGLSYGKGAKAQVFGGASHAGKVSEKFSVELLFPVSADITEFELLFMGIRVAKGKVGA